MTQYIQDRFIEEMDNKAFEHLQAAPHVRSQETVVEAAMDIAEVGGQLTSEWKRESLKGRNLYGMFSKGRGV